MKKVQSLVLVAIFFYIAYTEPVNGQPRKDCQTRCGNVTVEYPFGTSPGCYYAGDPNFHLTCKETGKLLFGGIDVINISHSGELRVMDKISYACYDKQGDLSVKSSYSYTLGSLSLSQKNKFNVVGCNALALLTTIGQQNYSTGCVSTCNSPSTVNGGDCNGAGCCRTDVSVPSDSYDSFEIYPSRLENMTSVHDFNPCTYAFLAEIGTFHFEGVGDLKNLRNVTDFPLVLDWSIGNQNCEQVGNRSICGMKNSTCFNSTRGTGYNCKCLDGYEGNPYLSNKHGCQDVNECTTNSTINKHNCSDPSTCRNKVGGFYCKCQSGYRLDTTTMSCKHKDYEWATILLGTTIGFLSILLVSSCVKQKRKHRKMTELQQKFFQQNGGGILVRRLSRPGTSNANIQIFTDESMKEATNGYEESRILGQGGQGTVYKGILPDDSVIAIKKARLGGDSSQVEQFINEVLVLSQINHRNVVKLLGCCLETEVPLLIYEFINSGTLSDHLHGFLFGPSLTWEQRLRIAVEIAGTLAYLHSSASIPIIHRDVKTANILLDENLTAKVADFGASRLIPMDKEQLTTMVQGTPGYLDPEYYNTGLLNEKSDVYSFGVVLMELLTGQKALCFERPLQPKHLVSYIVSAMKENRLHEVIDKKVIDEDNWKEIEEAARVAMECTRVTGEERPLMTEVAAKLEGLRVTKNKHQWSDQYPGQTEHLVGVHIISAQGGSSTIGYDSIKNVSRLHTSKLDADIY
ncbi:Wall-associated receptor kinase 1 [Raphanus sativus]|uniref:Wall-associated receptor kinase 1-like n=1 Tax=Raphanus sativus TaxID=3726 RepID=A0A9W3CNQ0_RAPSA|nr:wall-associated receptor kinase 1-like [Raphanus sativus]KAJ4871687.1 Wall-associated receptor kinase 1 [Raphanus sativus]